MPIKRISAFFHEEEEKWHREHPEWLKKEKENFVESSDDDGSDELELRPEWMKHEDRDDGTTDGGGALNRREVEDDESDGRAFDETDLETLESSVELNESYYENRPWKSVLRTAAIWVFGLLGSGIAGSLVGDALTYDGGPVGFFAGVFIFACLRLWLAAPSQ